MKGPRANRCTIAPQLRRREPYNNHEIYATRAQPRFFSFLSQNPDQNYEERRSPKLSTETKNGGLLFRLAGPSIPRPGHLNGFKFALIRLLRIAVESGQFWGCRCRGDVKARPHPPSQRSEGPCPRVSRQISSAEDDRLTLHTAPLHGVSHQIAGPKTTPCRPGAAIARLSSNGMLLIEREETRMEVSCFRRKSEASDPSTEIDSQVPVPHSACALP